jgi:hypothetical protein
MEPTVRSSGPALDATLPFVKQMRGFVRPSELQSLARDLRPTVPPLVELNKGGLNLQEQTRLAGSCNVNVLTPWNEETVPDPNFKPAGPIYQEASKQFVGLGGESRSFDANGQYVRSYANNGNYASVLGDGRFFFTDLPVQGVNPPAKKDGPPAFKPDTPCETQDRPDLRTKIQAPPTQRKISTSGPGFAERNEEATEKLMKWMQRELVRSGLEDKYTLTDEPLKASEIPLVRRTMEAGPR